MLSLLKKRSEPEAPAVTPAWHPNFRNYEKLPDVTAGRTAFFINGVSILVVVVLAVYFAFREWQLYGIGQQVAQVQAQIDRNKPASEAAIALYKKFQAEEARLAEVETFVKSKPSVSALLVRLAQTLPKNVAMDSIELRDTGLTLRLSVRGDSAAASGYTTAYLEQLRADKELSQFEEAIYTSTPTRNPGTGKMVVEFLLRTKAATGGKKP